MQSIPSLAGNGGASSLGARRPAAATMNFMRRFGALSFLTVAVAALATAAILSHFLAEEMLQWDAVGTAEFVGTVAEIQSAYGGYARRTGVAELLGRSSTPEELGVDASVVRASTAEFFDHMRTLPGAVAITIHARDGSVVWSYRKPGSTHGADDDAIERQFVLRAFSLPYSAAHAAIARWDYHTGDRASGEGGYYYVENYVPLYDATGRASVVVQIDKEPARLRQSLDRGHALVWTMLLTAGLLIFLALFWLARHATRVMQDQQRRLVESEKLGVIGEMSLAVAHGIRNPLAAIRSSAEIAVDEVPAAARKRLLDIVAQADRLSAWLHDLLRYAHPSHGSDRPVDVSDVLRESLGSLAGRLSQSAIAVETAGLDRVARVTADRPLLLQAFNSIMSNAMEAMIAGGTLTVECRRERGCVVVAIADTGPGMTAERLGQAFHPFKTSKARGLGIGLSLVKATIERYGGEIRIESAPDSGTRVELVIPAAR